MASYPTLGTYTWYTSSTTAGTGYANLYSSSHNQGYNMPNAKSVEKDNEYYAENKLEKW